MGRRVIITSKGKEITWIETNPGDPIPPEIQAQIDAEAPVSYATMPGVGDERETHEAAYDHVDLIAKKHIQITNARTLYVDKNGNDTTGDGTVGNPYQTIVAAVTQAKTMSPLYNAQVAIVIAPGFYEEHVIIDKDGISLYGYGQNVTQIQRAGTCLTHKINGTDYPWDAKVVGISFNSTNSEFSVRVEGGAGSSIAGNEIQYRDCRIAGSNSFYATTANFLDFQNTYVMGAVQIVNCAGCWVEQSEWGGAIIIDYDSANDQPANTDNYGIFLMTAITGSITLLNEGKIGDDRRVLKLDEYVDTPFTPTTSEDWTTSPTTIQEALDELAARVKVLETP